MALQQIVSLLQQATAATRYLKKFIVKLPLNVTRLSKRLMFHIAASYLFLRQIIHCGYENKALELFSVSQKVSLMHSIQFYS